MCLGEDCETRKCLALLSLATLHIIIIHISITFHNSLTLWQCGFPYRDIIFQACVVKFEWSMLLWIALRLIVVLLTLCVGVYPQAILSPTGDIQVCPDSLDVRG